MAKPTIKNNWIPDNTTNITDPGSRKTAGYVATDSPPAGEHNYIFNVASQWENFIDRAFGTTYYVKQSAGSDTNDGLTTSTAFQTIKKACDSIEDGGYGTIMLAEAGTYNITADIYLYSKKIRILQDSVNAEVNFNSYTTGSTLNSLYKFILSNSQLYIFTNTMVIPAPHNVANNWDNVSGSLSFASAFYSLYGLNHIYVGTTAGFTVTNTAAAGGYPCILGLNNNVINTLSANGTFTTNSAGYIVGSVSGDTPLYIVSDAGATIDSESYRLLNGATAVNQKLSTGALSASIGTFAVYVEGGSLTASATLPIVANETDANVETTIENWLNSLIKSATIGITVTTTRDGSSNITSLALEITGYSGQRLPMNLYWIGSTDEGYFEETQAPKPYGFNIISNY